MRLLLLMFVAGSTLVTALPALPDLDWLWLALPLAIALGWRRRTRWLSALLLGAAWSFTQCSAMMSQRLPTRLESKPLVVSGVVTGLPRRHDHRVQFLLELTRCPQCRARMTVRLSWYYPVSWLRPGQRWRFTVRLKRPHGLANPGLFDYEAWLLGKGISATGYVIPHHAHCLSGSGMRRLPDQLRYWLRDRILQLLPDTHITRLLIALTVGQSSQVSSADWRILSDTGTNHLMVISGLHIGLVAGFSYRVFLWLARWLVTSPTRWAGLFSLLTAAFYGLIAGLGLPVQRALVMASVAFSGVILNRRVTVGDMYCLALFLVTLLDPLAVMSIGFWLSFGAVLALVYAFAGRLRTRRQSALLEWPERALRTQWAAFAGMVPWLLFFVFQVAPVSLLVNLIAIPWIGLLVIPWLLLAIPALALMPSLASLLLHLASASLGRLWQFLLFSAHHGRVFYASDVSIPALLLALFGVAAILAPRGLVPRWLGLVMLLPVLVTADPPAAGEVRIRILDVGEGLAAIVNTRKLRLVYESPGVMGGGFDLEQAVVTPMLRRFGDPRYLDALVVSHGPAAPRETLRHNFLVGRVLTNAGKGQGGCGQRRKIRAGQVEFIFLPVTAGKTGGCALLVKSGDFALLLPGDVDALGERHLMHSGIGRVDVMVAPRNGSGTASSPAFLNAVAPRVVVFSTAYGNRFGHPDTTVVKRYVNRGVTAYNTAHDGAILIDYKRGSGVEISTARGRRQRFWYD